MWEMKPERLIFIVGAFCVIGTLFVFAHKVFGGTMNISDDKGMYIYVFNDKTQLWDRAREETLKNATCEHLYMYVVGEKQ